MKTALCSGQYIYSVIIYWIFLLLIEKLLPANAFKYCHDDGSLEVEAGLLPFVEFTWLGSLQYIHVKSGAPHFFRVPRVVLVHKQFVLSTAHDAADVPQDYALGNVVFGDYERDETECTLTKEQFLDGNNCKPTVMLMPIADVLIHPEYKHFEVKHSVALLKLIIALKSTFVLPVCLPILDFIGLDANDTIKPKNYYYVDFETAVPRDFGEERKILIDLEFSRNAIGNTLDTENIDQNKTDVRIGYSTGCGLRSGAPTVVHEHTGHWTVVALAQGGPSCRDPLRRRSNFDSAGHIMVEPYVAWISKAIAGRSSASMTMEDPFGVTMLRSFLPNQLAIKRGWVGKWWMGGIRCYARGYLAARFFRFYHEQFIIEPTLRSAVTYRVEINAPLNHRIVCVKVAVPNRLAQPKAWDIETDSVKIEVVVPSVTRKFVIEVEGYAESFAPEQVST